MDDVERSVPNAGLLERPLEGADGPLRTVDTDHDPTRIAVVVVCSPR